MEIPKDSLAGLFSRGPVALLVWANQPGWPVMYASPSVEALFGVSPEELVSGDFAYTDLLDPDHIPHLVVEVDTALAANAEVLQHDDYEIRRPDGTTRWVADFTAIERDDSGEAVRFVGYVFDVTDRKRAEQARSEFLARMSHEIRTPLNGILGVTELLGGTQLDTEQAEYVDTLRQSGDGLRTIIDDVLDLSTIESGNLSVEPASFSLRAELDAVSNVFRERAKAKGLRLTVAVDAEVPTWLFGDPHRIRQILVNLVSNAIKFTRDGYVTVHARGERSGDSEFDLVVEVLDSGSGIEDLESIWEPFQQGDPSIRRSHGGTGLGLAISRQLAELMDGELDAASQKDDGSCFQLRLSLPVAQEPLVEDSSATLPDVSGLRVLVVEDNLVNQMVIRRMLERMGASVEVVDSGKMAVEACGRVAFDVVLMDVHMPGVSGIETTRRILMSDSAVHPVVLAVTADVMEENRRNCLDAGMKEVLEKPVRFEDLRRAIWNSRQSS